MITGRIHPLLHVLTALATLVSAQLVLAAEPQAAAPATPQRPRIGLVLGGGGAKGLAHVGIIDVLERNRIPVDAVAGTSMGAVVGSLYAVGNDAKQLNEIAYTVDWNGLFDDAIPRDKISFRRKRDERDILIDYRLNVSKGKLSLPRGVLRGQELYLTLAELLSPGRGVDDFDQLAIPFRAVATEITTGKSVVLGEGDIATAAYASMAVPGGFPPLERDGLLLVDGGVVDNVPIDVARAMGVDIVIVVDVGTPLLKRDEISSFVDVLNQLQLLLGRDNIERQIKSLGPRDVLIQPNVEGLSMTSFGEVDETVKRGTVAAEAALPRLRSLALSEAEWQRYIAERQARRPTLSPEIDFVRVVNNSPTPTAAIEQKITQTADEPFDAKAMTRDLSDVYSMGGFRAVSYEILEENGRRGVEIRTEADPTASDFFQVGFALDSDFDRNSSFTLGLAYTDRYFFDTNVEWRTDVRLGEDLLFETSFYLPIGKTAFVDLIPSWRRRDLPYYEGDQRLGEVRTKRWKVALEPGLLFGTWGELRAGPFIGQVDLSESTGQTGVQPATFDDGGYSVQLRIDTLDQLRFPGSGWAIQSRFVDHVEAFGADFDYWTWGTTVSKPISFGPTTVSLRGTAEFSSDDAPIGEFQHGGFLDISGLDENQLNGRYAFIGGAVLYHRVSATSPLFDLPLYVGGSLELGNTYDDLDDVSFGSLRWAGSAFVAADTPLGPLSRDKRQKKIRPAVKKDIGRNKY